MVWINEKCSNKVVKNTPKFHPEIIISHYCTRRLRTTLFRGFPSIPRNPTYPLRSRLFLKTPFPSWPNYPLKPPLCYGNPSTPRDATYPIGRPFLRDPTYLSRPPLFLRTHPIPWDPLIPRPRSSTRSHISLGNPPYPTGYSLLLASQPIPRDPPHSTELHLCHKPFYNTKHHLFIGTASGIRGSRGIGHREPLIPLSS